MPPPRRKCREAAVDPNPSRDSVVKNNARDRRLGRDSKEEYLSPGAVSSDPKPSGGEEGRSRRGELDANRRLLHASRWCRVQRFGWPVFRPSGQRSDGQATHPTTSKPWDRCGTKDCIAQRTGYPNSFTLEMLPMCPEWT